MFFHDSPKKCTIIIKTETGRINHQLMDSRVVVLNYLLWFGVVVTALDTCTLLHFVLKKSTKKLVESAYKMNSCFIYFIKASLNEATEEKEVKIKGEQLQ